MKPATLDRREFVARLLTDRGDLLVIECTDPLTSIDIPNLLNQTGDTLEGHSKAKKVLTFRIRKK